MGSLRELFGVSKQECTDRSIAEILQSDCVAINQLRQIKQFSKKLGQQSGKTMTQRSSLPREIPGLIYLLSIAVTNLRFAVNPSASDKQTLCQRMAKFVDVQWMDQNSIEVLQSFIATGPTD